LFAACPARALVSIPLGTPFGTATDLLTVTGVYSTLPSPLAPPFESPDFTLSIVVPAQVTVSAAGPVLSEFYVLVDGTYTNNGQTQTFTNAMAFFGATDTGISTYPNNFTLDVSGLLIPTDFISVSFQANQPLFHADSVHRGDARNHHLGESFARDRVGRLFHRPGLHGHGRHHAAVRGPGALGLARPARGDGRRRSGLAPASNRSSTGPVMMTASEDCS
jgi:hypothetical protein